jgi:hypothetical protein
LPYSDLAAKIAFYVVVGVFAAFEWRIRLRSHLNRQGSRSERILFDGLGEPYRRFAATRKRLVPGLW